MILYILAGNTHIVEQWWKFYKRVTWKEVYDVDAVFMESILPRIRVN